MALENKTGRFFTASLPAIPMFAIFILGERTTSHQFILHTESTWKKKADWTLAAQTESEMKDWILAFKVSEN